MSRETRRARRERASRCDPGNVADRFALRDAIVTDPDAEVRAAALLRLDEMAARALLPYVRDAVDDPSMRVREAAFVALARARDAASLPRAEAVCRYDRGFRVRRMALLFATRACGADALPVLAMASRDPFWRVRVAARRAGAALDAAVDATAPAGEAMGFSVGDLGELEDADPAVVVARLVRTRGEVAPRALVSLLGHSHQALRRVAIHEIASRGDAPTLHAVTRWLLDERLPYGPAAAEAVLARSGARADAVATAILHEAEAQPAGPLAWALGAAVQAPGWRCITALVEHGDARVRRAAVLRAPEVSPDRTGLLALMGARLEDPDLETRRRAASWLARTGSRDARAALLQIGGDAPGQPTLIRALLVQLRADAGDVDGLRALANDVHGGVRAAALVALSQRDALTPTERHVLEQDPDPWIRHAVLVPARAMQAVRDASALVRTTAIACLDPADARAWSESVDTANEPEASLRARAASLLAGAGTENAARALLRLARDVDFGVRSAAVAALDAHRNAVRVLLERDALTPSERMAAYTLLRLDEGDDGGAYHETDPQARAHLDLLEDVRMGRPLLPRHETMRPAVAASPHHRRLGRTGLVVHPFGLSGAHGLASDDFAIARERGVNLFFWEPSHRELARFLCARHGAGAVVVAGTYHADAANIERDVVRALRALRREAIDVFLAFWTRSPARIDEITDVLQRLAQRGLIRATGASTHDRALACEAVDRGLDVVMIRHSAAHRGAESAVFPHAAARGAGVLTFSNLCYGRMLHRSPAVLSAKVTAPDCYRYSLSQPGVHACIAAPRRHSELMENLAVAGDPSMDVARQNELRAHGEHVYARSKAWSAETWRVAEHPKPRVAPAEDPLSDWIDQPDSISADPW